MVCGKGAVRQDSDGTELYIMKIRDALPGCEGVSFARYFFFSSILFCNSSIYPAVMIPAGSATMAIPNIDDIMVTTLPIL